MIILSDYLTEKPLFIHNNQEMACQIELALLPAVHGE